MTDPREIRLTIDYWQDDGWYFGRARQCPDVFSQARTLAGLKAMIADAFVCRHQPAADDKPADGTLEFSFPHTEEGPLPVPDEDRAEMLTKEEAAEMWAEVCAEATHEAAA